MTILRNITGLVKGVALSTAKALKNKGADAPFAGDGPGSPDTPAWVAEVVRIPLNFPQSEKQTHEW